MKTIQVALLMVATLAVTTFTSCTKESYTASGTVHNSALVSLPATNWPESHNVETTSIDLGIDEFINEQDIKPKKAQLKSLVPINIKVRLMNLERYQNFEFLEDLELVIVHPSVDLEIPIGHLDAGTRNGWDIQLNNTFLDVGSNTGSCTHRGM